MKVLSLEPVRIGMAGVIYSPPSLERDGKQEESFFAAFAVSPQTRKTEWRGRNIYAVIVELDDEAGGNAGKTSCPLPSVGDCEGIVYGHYFGSGDAGATAEVVSRRVCECYDRDGVGAFEKLNGAWAAVLWDGARRQAYLVRDRLGVETLYAKRLPDRVVFSTDVRVLLSLGLGDELDEQALAEFLHYLYVPAPLTIAAGVQAVLPGHFLRLNEDSQQVRYASPRFVVGAGGETSCDLASEESRYVSELEEHLVRAVTDCLPRAGRVALALSGGKDSSSLAVVLSKICPDRVLAFNVGSSNVLHDEESDAALVAKSLGLAFKPYVPTGRQLAEGLHHFLAVQGQPIGDLAALPYFLGIRDLPEDCRVVLDGTGNDYYFGIPSVEKGAHRYGRRLQIEGSLPPAAWKLLLRLMALGPGALRRLSRFWAEPIEESFVAWEGWSQQELSGLCQRDVSFAGTYLWKVMRDGRQDEWIQLLTNVVCGVWEPHAAFRKAHHFAHALGRGIRFPYTDDRLAAFINHLPAALRFDGGKNKILLRAFMARHLPKEILTKPKSPFIFDLSLLLSNTEYSWVTDLSRKGLLRAMPGWNDEAIRDLLTRYAKEPRDSRWQCRVYTLCLLASVLALRAGWRPSLENS
jgi:asparagine synthase (glutamine-hydrolysing)